MSARIVAALGVTQIIGYGTLYYAFPIAVPALAASCSCHSNLPQLTGFAAELPLATAATPDSLAFAAI